MSFSRSDWLRGDNEESDEEEIQEGYIRDRPDAIVYLIDVSPSMHATTEVDDKLVSNISTALRSALALMKTRIISGSPRDMVGVVLYNTLQANNVEGELTKEGIYMLLEPKPVKAASIKMLTDLVEEAENDPEAFQKERFTPIDLEVKTNRFTDAMTFSQRLLKTNSSNLSNKTLNIITDDDDPFRGNKQQQSVACVFAKDQHEAGYAIKTFFMPENKADFDLTKFWNRFRFDPSEDVDMDNASMIFSGEVRFDKLLSVGNEAGKTKRAQFSIPFYLYEDLAMSVTGYAAIGEQKKKAAIDVEQAEEIREVYAKAQYTEAATGEDVDAKKDIVRYASIGTKDANEQRIFFENDEVTKIKNLGMSPSLKLLGFMQRSMIKEQHTNKHSYLIYPNETEYANSIPAFSALLKSMVKKNVVGVAVLIARSNSSPQIVYLVPQAEKRDEETDVQLDPPCIWLIQVPFADDIRDPVKTTFLSAVCQDGEANAMIQTAKKIIKKMKISYTPSQFVNPNLQFHYAVPAAIALQEDEPGHDDATLPRTEDIIPRIGSLVRQLKIDLEQHPKLHEYGWSKGTAGTARADDDDVSEKKPRVSKEKASQNIDKLERTLVEAYKKGSIGKVTNDTMKDYLKQKNLKPGTKKKAELLVMVKQQLLDDGKLTADEFDSD